MHLIRTSAVVITLGCLAAGAQLVACGGEGTEPRPNGPGTEASAGPSAPTSIVSTSRASVYLGQVARIDGAKIAPGVSSDQAWTLVDVPPESAIKTERIEDRATLSPRFEPDALGKYTLHLSGKKDGVSASVTVIVEAIDAPVFYQHLLAVAEVGADGNPTFSATTSTHVVGAHRLSESREVACPVTQGATSEDFDSLVVLLRDRPLTADAWEAPAGMPSRLVYASAFRDLSRGVLTSTLAVATSESKCGAPDARILHSTENAVSTDYQMLNDVHIGARFSPNGDRVAFEHLVGGTLHLSSIGFDGKDKHDLSVLDASMFQGPVNESGKVPMRWQDDRHVGWVFSGTGQADPSLIYWELWTMEDKAGATPSLAMRCNGSAVARFDFLPNGDVVTLVGSPGPKNSLGGDDVVDLVVYHANATTKACELVKNLTNADAATAVPIDFALSPDKSQVAFAAMKLKVADDDTAGFLANLASVPVDGSRAAVPLSGSASDGAGPPRWAAGGSVITWVRGSGNAPASISAIPKGGGQRTQLVDVEPADTSATKETRHYVFGIGQGCSATPGTIANGATSAFGGLALFALVARRRRRATSSPRAEAA